MKLRAVPIGGTILAIRSPLYVMRRNDESLLLVDWVSGKTKSFIEKNRTTCASIDPRTDTFVTAWGHTVKVWHTDTLGSLSWVLADRTEMITAVALQRTVVAVGTAYGQVYLFSRRGRPIHILDLGSRIVRLESINEGLFVTNEAETSAINLSDLGENA